MGLDFSVLDWGTIIVTTIISTLIAIGIAIYFRFFTKPKIEKIYENNRNKTISRLLNDIYNLDEYVGLSIQIITKQIGFDRGEQKSYEVTKQEADRLQYYLKQTRQIDKSIQENQTFLLQYMEYEEFSVIGSYVKNSANFFIFPEQNEETEKIPIFCFPQYMCSRIFFARKLLELFDKQLKFEFISEWNEFLRNYKSPYD
jgi:hypothetical protein